jgi:hypothetical protein
MPETGPVNASFADKASKLLEITDADYSKVSAC